MIVLGIADNHDSGAAVLVDNRLVAAVNQERIDRVKSSGAFPWGAIDAALETAGVAEREVDRVVVGTAFTPAAPLRAFPERHAAAREQGQFSPMLHAYVLYQSALRATGLHTLDVDIGEQILRSRLKARPFGRAGVELVDHHRAHAEAAYRTQSAAEALVLTLDAMGDGLSVTVSVGRDGQLDRLYRQSGLSSINNFYARITELLGFVGNRHEGKVMGLAAQAEPPQALLAHMRLRLRFVGPGFSRTPIRHEPITAPFWAEIARYSREEVAAAAQRTLEDAVCDFVRYWVGKTGVRTLTVAGGTFANVRLNHKIAQLDEVDRLWVLPHMGDGGLAVGAVLTASQRAPEALPDAYLGPGFKDQQHYKALSLADLPRNQLREGDGPVLDQLLAGRIVCRFDGRMEWGPRALCNRSILARADDAEAPARLNKALSRNDFMPFAPVIRAEDAPRLLRGLDRAPEAARFMTVCFEATPELRRVAPAAVHVDGTVRPQVLTARDNPSVHALLGALGERTGCPVLINTSFNIHEEPIVCTPGDAIRTWRRSGLDALWMGQYLVAAR